MYHACRALLVHRQDQIAIFDRAFAAFWREHHERQPRANARDAVELHRVPLSVEIEDVLAPEDLDETAGSDGTSGADRNDDAPEDERDAGSARQDLER